MDRSLGSEVEGIDKTLDSLSDEMMRMDEEETCLGWRSGMMICFSFKSLWTVEDLFLEDEKIVLTSNTFLTVVSFFDAEGSLHNSMDGAVRILGRQGVDACFAFEVDASLIKNKK